MLLYDRRMPTGAIAALLASAALAFFAFPVITEQVAVKPAVERPAAKPPLRRAVRPDRAGEEEALILRRLLEGRCEYHISPEGKAQCWPRRQDDQQPLTD
jgi:hypothetical protein